jgi:hypothetical protein
VPRRLNRRRGPRHPCPAQGWIVVRSITGEFDRVLSPHHAASAFEEAHVKQRFRYVTTHREDTIDRMSLEPDRDEERISVAGDPFDEQLVGPSSGAWGRTPGEAGRVAFFTTEDGTTALPSDRVLRTSKVLRVEF